MRVINVAVGAYGPTIDLVVGVSGPRMSALVKAGQPVPQPQVVRALLDTGASCTTIDRTVLRKLQLQPIGSILIHTPSTGDTAHQCSQFDVSLAVLHPTDQHLVLPAVPVCEADFSLQAIDALIGRDVLSRCLLVYDGINAQCTLSF